MEVAQAHERRILSLQACPCPRRENPWEVVRTRVCFVFRFLPESRELLRRWNPAPRVVPIVSARELSGLCFTDGIRIGPTVSARRSLVHESSAKRPCNNTPTGQILSSSVDRWPTWWLRMVTLQSLVTTLIFDSMTQNRWGPAE